MGYLKASCFVWHIFSFLRLGPGGGRRGFSGKTGLPASNLVWYIEGLMVPDIYLKRGRDYTFKVNILIFFLSCSIYIDIINYLLFPFNYHTLKLLKSVSRLEFYWIMKLSFFPVCLFNKPKIHCHTKTIHMIPIFWSIRSRMLKSNSCLFVIWQIGKIIEPSKEIFIRRTNLFVW